MRLTTNNQITALASSRGGSTCVGRTGSVSVASAPSDNAAETELVTLPSGLVLALLIAAGAAVVMARALLSLEVLS